MIEFLQSHWIEIIGSLLGLFYLYFEYKAMMLMWPVGILMSCFYIYVLGVNEFYAGATINIYYILLGIYGWVSWDRLKQQRIILRHVALKHYATILVMVALLWVVLSKILEQTGSMVYVADSLITSLSIVAMWMLTQRYIEQWFLLIIANILSVFVYAYAQLYPTMIMYVVYAIVSIAAYFHWKKLASSQ